MAGEAAAQAEARAGSSSSNGGPVPVRARQGTCRCGLPATAGCSGGCGRPACGEHLLNRSSRLAWPGPYRSEREHTTYLRAFWADAGPVCTWCREAAGVAALTELAPVPPLPDGAIERLAVLRAHPHDYPRDAWDQAVLHHGGAAAVLRLLAPSLHRRSQVKEFEGRRTGEVLSGVSVGSPGAEAAYELVDAAGVVWTVRPLGSGVLRKRRAWAWERAPEERVAQLLPRIVELAAP